MIPTQRGRSGSWGRTRRNPGAKNLASLLQKGLFKWGTVQQEKSFEKGGSNGGGEIKRSALRGGSGCGWDQRYHAERSTSKAHGLGAGRDRVQTVGGGESVEGSHWPE